LFRTSGVIAVSTVDGSLSLTQLNSHTYSRSNPTPAATITPTPRATAGRSP